MMIVLYEIVLIVHGIMNPRRFADRRTIEKQGGEGNQEGFARGSWMKRGLARSKKGEDETERKRRKIRSR